MLYAFPYQGSKRTQAEIIISRMPKFKGRLIEPFAGSSAVTLRAAQDNISNSFWINDINYPIIELWENIIVNPILISNLYEELWNGQFVIDNHYNNVRDLFNKTKESHYLLYLLCRCVKASVRYNSNGEFNQSSDKRRNGVKPPVMRENLKQISNLLHGKTKLSSLDYKEVFNQATPDDLLYLDPPYQGTSKGRDKRYIESVDRDEFVNALFDLTKREVPFILSYDGKTGNRSYGIELPSELGLQRLEIQVGKSAQSTLLGIDEYSYENLYLSGGNHDF
jgi:DNA adenine methylase